MLDERATICRDDLLQSAAEEMKNTLRFLTVGNWEQFKNSCGKVQGIAIVLEEYYTDSEAEDFTDIVRHRKRM